MDKKGMGCIFSKQESYRNLNAGVFNNTCILISQQAIFKLDIRV